METENGAAMKVDHPERPLSTVEELRRMRAMLMEQQAEITANKQDIKAIKAGKDSV